MHRGERFMNRREKKRLKGLEGGIVMRDRKSNVTDKIRERARSEGMNPCSGLVEKGKRVRVNELKEGKREMINAEESSGRYTFTIDALAQQTTSANASRPHCHAGHPVAACLGALFLPHYPYDSVDIQKGSA
jgi:hypothetical protein